MKHAYTYATTKDTGNRALQMTLYVIAMHVNVETGTTFAGIRKFMAEAKVRSDRTMRNYIARLETQGLFKREKRTRPNGGNSTDLIELVGFVDWFRAQHGVADPAEITRGVNVGGSQKLPGGPGSAELLGGSGRQATAPVNSQSLTKGIKPNRGQQRQNKKNGGTDSGSGDAVRQAQSVLDTGAVSFARHQSARAQHMQFDVDNETFRISDDDRRTIEMLGGDVEELFDRATMQGRKGRRPIGNVARYMVTMAKNDAKAKHGVVMGVVEDIATGNQHQRAAAYGALAEATVASDRLNTLRRAPMPSATPQLLPGGQRS